MEKLIQNLIISGTIAIAFFSFTFNAFAASLEVTFTPNPLFNKPNFLPNDNAKSTVIVKNNSTETQTIVTEAINAFDNDNLGSQILIAIEDTNDILYNDQLSDFLSTAGEISLGTIVPNATRTFTYTVVFTNTNDNNYQEKTLGFDVCVGFSGRTKHCGDTVVKDENNTNNEGGGRGGNVFGSGSGGDAPTVLTIINERILSSADVDEFSSTATATIVWDTNVLSTSQVVYGPIPPMYVLDMNAFFFGYPFGTIEDTTKVTNHSVLLTGLIGGQTYVYRVVSRASPPTISFERQFTAPMTAPLSLQVKNNNGDNNFIGSNLFFNTDVSEISEIDTLDTSFSVNSEGEIMAKEENVLNLNNNLLTATALFFSLGNLISNNILIFIFLIFIILCMVWKFWLHKKS